MSYRPSLRGVPPDALPPVPFRIEDWRAPDLGNWEDESPDPNPKPPRRDSDLEPLRSDPLLSTES